MKKVFLPLFLFVTIFAFGVKKPLLKSGFVSQCDLKLSASEKYIYPSTLKDAVFISFQEEISDYFLFYHKIEFEYKNYNKFTKNIDDLKNINLRNNIKFDFSIDKSNKIIFYTTPTFIANSENIFKLANKIEYKLTLKNFSFNVYYSNNFTLKENEIFNHKINCSFYFSIPKKSFIKFKTSSSINLQHRFYGGENIFPLKSGNFSFEVAFDFNNKSFDELFNGYLEEEEFNF